MIGYFLSKFYAFWNRAYAKLFSLALGGGFYGFGFNSVIAPPIRFSGIKQIQIGRKVYIGPNSWLMAQKSSDSNCPIIKIGDGCSAVGGLTISGVSNIEIEDEVLIARNVYISDHSHRFDDPELSIKFQGIDRIAPVRIGKGTWIGQNAVIFPGVSIGRNAVIGANSVVRESVPDRCVAAGVPAKIIRMLD